LRTFIINSCFEGKSETQFYANSANGYILLFRRIFAILKLQFMKTTDECIVLLRDDNAMIGELDFRKI